MGGGGSKQGVTCKLEKRKLKQCSKEKTDLNNVRKRNCVYNWILINRFLVVIYNYFVNIEEHEWKHSL